MKNAAFVIILLLTIIGTSCATLEKEKEVVVEEKVQPRFEGITGILQPVDANGNEILYQDKETILVNLIPIKNGEKLIDRAVAFHPHPDGRFISELGDGNYAVEILLDGFYVKRFDITVHKNELLDLGVIDIQKIETDISMPLKGEQTEEVITNEGDVNIEPPSL